MPKKALAAAPSPKVVQKPDQGAHFVLYETISLCWLSCLFFVCYAFIGSSAKPQQKKAPVAVSEGKADGGNKSQSGVAGAPRKSLISFASVLCWGISYLFFWFRTSCCCEETAQRSCGRQSARKDFWESVGGYSGPVFVHHYCIKGIRETWS